MKDPLLSLLRLRSMALDDARRIVAEALEVQNDAQQRMLAAESRLADETRAATALEGEDAAVEAFARWLPLGQADLARCRKTEHEAGAAVDRARAALALARAGLKSVETLIERRATADALALARREQAQIDDIRPRPRDFAP